METRQVINQYKMADLGRRLDMYLYYPELRAKFVKIDQAGEKASAPSPSAWKILLNRCHHLKAL